MSTRENDDFEKTSIEVDAEIPSEAWEQACKQYHEANDEENDSTDLFDILQNHIELEYNWTIQPSNPEILEWEDAGRKRLALQVDDRLADVDTAFGEVAGKLERGETITETDVAEMRHTMERLKTVAELAATVSPDAEPQFD